MFVQVINLYENYKIKQNYCLLYACMLYNMLAISLSLSLS